MIFCRTDLGAAIDFPTIDTLGTYVAPSLFQLSRTGPHSGIRWGPFCLSSVHLSRERPPIHFMRSMVSVGIKGYRPYHVG